MRAHSRFTFFGKAFALLITNTALLCLTPTMRKRNWGLLLVVMMMGFTSSKGYNSLVINNIPFFIEATPPVYFPSLLTTNDVGELNPLVIENLEFYPAHRLFIFSADGKLVYEAADYAQNWPQTTADAKEAPNRGAIHFYVLELGDGVAQSGYLAVAD